METASSLLTPGGPLCSLRTQGPAAAGLLQSHLTRAGSRLLLPPPGGPSSSSGPPVLLLAVAGLPASCLERAVGQVGPGLELFS